MAAVDFFRDNTQIKVYRNEGEKRRKSNQYKTGQNHHAHSIQKGRGCRDKMNDTAEQQL